MVLSSPAGALDLPLPTNAVPAAEDTQALDSLSLPVGPWTGGNLEIFAAEGAVTRRAWTVANSGLTTLQMITPLREALIGESYEILYECRDRDCGGFDFRYQLSLLPEPFMHVDLGDFRYLVAKAPSGLGLVSLTVSRSAETGFLHLTRVDEPGAVPDVVVTSTTVNTPEVDPEPDGSDLATRLETEGRMVLEGLRFATGSANLESAEFPALATLAAWLKAAPDIRVVLVGHSDAVGTLSANIALSRARARSVVRRLVEAHGVARGQLQAEGAGYLSPRAPNATADGRALNRRVEVVVLPDG